MAEYCTSADVISSIKNIVVSATTAVTTTKLADIVTNASAMIDAHIQERYTLPISETTALSFLKKICIDICVYEVTKILQAKDTLQLPDGRVVQDISSSSAYREAMRMLKDIQNGKMSLPAETLTEKDNVSFSVNYDPEESFEFKHNEQQW